MRATDAPAADLHRFDSRGALAEALAANVADALRTAIAERGQALLAVSGGSTPKLFFDALSRQPLDWDKVTVTLVDERWVERDSDRANAKLVASLLLRNDAGTARFVDLYLPGMAIDDAAPVLDTTIKALGAPDAVVLGMGADGHTASFFPGGDGLAAATDPATHAAVTVVHAAAAGEPRVTLTLPVLLGAGLLALHIEGEEKRRVLEEALAAGEANDLPIRHVLHNRTDLQIYWAP